VAHESHTPGVRITVSNQYFNRLEAAKQIKEFNAVCPTTKQKVVSAYSMVTALTDKRSPIDR